MPEGYNKAEDVEFTVTSTMEGTALNGLSVSPSENFTVTLEEGTMETSIVNNTGTELPETGGMGTTIFYVVGAVMVIGAAVVMITRKRMDV